MQKSFKLVLVSLYIVFTGLTMFAQETGEYKDVILDGKPAKLNITTGEITLVIAEKKVVNTKKDSLKTNPILVMDNQVIGASPEVQSEGDSTSDFHSVRDGESLLDISKKYNVSLRALKRGNNLETTLINKGQKLRVKNFNILLIDAKPELLNDSSNRHIVKNGETLYGLAKRYDLSVTELKTLNDLNTDVIKVGQKLRVKSFLGYNINRNNSVWTVSKGDTLFGIARVTKVSVDTIKKLNGLTNNLIKIGQKLRLK